MPGVITLSHRWGAALAPLGSRGRKKADPQSRVCDHLLRGSRGAGSEAKGPGAWARKWQSRAFVSYSSPLPGTERESS